jgi:NitT/TauT family transport system permease protein
MWAALATPGAAALALALHRWLPNRQETPPSGWYPRLLLVLLVTMLVLAVAQLAWQPLRRRVRHYGPLVAAAIGWLCVWDLATLKLALLPLPYFPGPDLVLLGITEEWRELLINVYYSLRLLLTGYFVGVGLGLVSGVLMGWFRAARFWGMPVMKLVGPLPATALVPVAMVLSTNSFYSGTALIGFAVWFPVTMLTMSGLSNVPASYFDVARTLGAGRVYLIFRVAIPASLPSIFIGLFMGLGASFLTLYVAETVGVRHGLGYYLEEQRSYAIYDKVYGALIIMAFFFSGIMTVLFRVRDRLLRWQKGVIRW